MTHRETHTSTNAEHATKNTQPDESFTSLSGLKKSSFDQKKTENLTDWMWIFTVSKASRLFGSFVDFLPFCVGTSGSSARFSPSLNPSHLICKINDTLFENENFSMMILYFFSPFLHKSQTFRASNGQTTRQRGHFLQRRKHTHPYQHSPAVPSPLPSLILSPTYTKAVAGKHTPCMRTPKSPPLLIFTLKYFPLRRLQNCLHPDSEGK